MGALQIGYNKGEVSFIDHFPMHTLRAENAMIKEKLRRGTIILIGRIKKQTMN